MPVAAGVSETKSPAQPTDGVMPGGVVIRNLPDGSQIITMPDGRRVMMVTRMASEPSLIHRVQRRRPAPAPVPSP